MAQESRPRHVRQRVFSRLRHASSNFKQFLAAQSARLLASATGQTFTAVGSTDVCSATAHGFVTGKGPVFVSNSGGALPTGLVAATFYWPIVIDADTFYLATTRSNAADGIRVDLSSNGTGTQTIIYAVTPAALMERLRQGVTPEDIRAASDIDSL